MLHLNVKIDDSFQSNYFIYNQNYITFTIFRKDLSATFKLKEDFSIYYYFQDEKIYITSASTFNSLRYLIREHFNIESIKKNNVNFTILHIEMKKKLETLKRLREASKELKKENRNSIDKKIMENIQKNMNIPKMIKKLYYSENGIIKCNKKGCNIQFKKVDSFKFIRHAQSHKIYIKEKGQRGINEIFSSINNIINKNKYKKSNNLNNILINQLSREIPKNKLIKNINMSPSMIYKYSNKSEIKVKFHIYKRQYEKINIDMIMELLDRYCTKNYYMKKEVVYTTPKSIYELYKIYQERNNKISYTTFWRIVNNIVKPSTLLVCACPICTTESKESNKYKKHNIIVQNMRKKYKNERNNNIPILIIDFSAN